MNSDEYAGFLRLWLNPSSRLPSLTEDVESYLRYANRKDPVTSVMLNMREASKHAA